MCGQVVEDGAQTPAHSYAQRGVADHHIIVRLQPEVALADGSAEMRAVESLLDAWSVTRVKRTFPAPREGDDLFRAHRLDQYLTLEVPPGTDTIAMARALAERETLFASAEPDWIGSQHGSQPPHDPGFGIQWALQNTGQDINWNGPGVPGADMQALQAWAFTKGSTDVIIAVLDAGVSESHPDLTPKIIDGWNFIDNSSNTDDQYNSHGTLCAGIAAARSDNGLGITGVSWHSSIMPVTVVNRFGFGDQSTLANGLIWAADNGARVANVSLGFGTGTQFLKDAVAYATDAGLLICCSTGNVPTLPIEYPAKYTKTMAVAATNNRDELWPSSSTGSRMTVVAPGVDICATWDSILPPGPTNPGENTYRFVSGTSFACPQVAGVAALLYAEDPLLTPDDVRTLIEASAADLGDVGWDETYGFGRVNAYKALRLLRQDHDRPDGGGWEDECLADFDNNGHVDSHDLVEYIVAFSSGDPRADIAPVFGVIDSNDLLAFIQAFNRGCADEGSRPPWPGL